MTSLALYNPKQATTAWNSLYQSDVKPLTMAGHKLRLSVTKETRSTAQNARMWAMLQDVANQVIWHGRKLAKEDWKHVFSASLKKQDAVPGIDGGFVVLGQSTSQMTIPEMSDLMMLMDAFGANNGVRFSAPDYEDAA
jgi:hypothetical protein